MFGEMPAEQVRDAVERVALEVLAVGEVTAPPIAPGEGRSMSLMSRGPSGASGRWLTSWAKRTHIACSRSWASVP